MQQYQLWPILCNNLKSPYLHHFITIQEHLEQMSQQIEFPHICEQIANQIYELVNQIVQIIEIDQQHLLEGFYQSIQLFLQIDKENKVQIYQAIHLCQELFDKLAISYFYKEEEKQEEKNELPINDDASTCSDFSDDNFEVEDFEASVAIDLFQQIRSNLSSEEIQEKCLSFQFIITDGDLNIFEFFTDALQLNIRQYDLILFLNYSGLLHRLMNYKIVATQYEYFIQQFYTVLNKIQFEDIEEMVSSNNFEMKYTRLSQRRFMRCKFLTNIYSRIVFEKLERWKLNQEIKDIQGENLKQLRRFIIINKAPLSRWEVSILSIQDVQLNYKDLMEKMQKLIIALELKYDDLLEKFISIDKLYVNLKQFSKWIQISKIPLTIPEISDLFNQCSQIIGYYTSNGIKVIQRCDFYLFLDKLYGLNTEIDKTNKYSDEITLVQYNKHLQLKIQSLKQQLIDQSESQQQQQQQQQQISQQNTAITDTSLQENVIRQDICWQSEIADLKSQHQQQLKMSELKWKNKTKDLLFELENKDKQISHYRMQLEALIKELEWVKTERYN